MKCSCCNYTCGGCSDDSITFSINFAEAMALDPNEVEVFDNLLGKWVPLSQCGRVALEIVRLWTFRRARPKRSRVDELAAAKLVPDVYSTKTLVSDCYTEAIRAVCEWLRENLSSCRAADIEREFLEPR